MAWTESSFIVDYQKWTVSEYLLQICKGYYGLPEFQRIFVWDEDKVLLLWESMYVGIPIGQLLLWEVPHELRTTFPMRSLSTVQGKLLLKEEEKITTCVVDGQQRLNAIYLTMKGELEFQLAFDLDKKKFTYSKSGNVVKLNILSLLPYDDAKFSGWFNYMASEAQKKLHSKELGRLNAILTESTQCTIPAQIIKGANYNTVTDIFKRVNVQGVQLTKSQIAIAGISKMWVGVFNKVYETLNLLDQQIGFGDLKDPEFVVMAWTAVHTGQHKIKYLSPEKRSKFIKLASQDKYEESWEKLTKGLMELVKILKEFLKLDNFQFVRSYYPLIIVTHYLAQHEATVEDKKKLAQWIVASILSGRYREKSLTKLREDIRYSVQEKPLDNLFLYEPYGLDPDNCRVGEVDLTHELFKSTHSPYVTLLYMLMRNQGAVDFYVPNVNVGDMECNVMDLEQYLIPYTSDDRQLDELPEDKSKSYSIRWHFHHIFPKARFDDQLAELRQKIKQAEENEDEDLMKLLEERKKTFEEKIWSVANLAYILPLTNILISDRDPTEYLDEIRRKRYQNLNITGDEILRRQFIPIDPVLWQHAEFDNFCKEREKLIISAAKNADFITNT